MGSVQPASSTRITIISAYPTALYIAVRTGLLPQPPGLNRVSDVGNTINFRHSPTPPNPPSLKNLNILQWSDARGDARYDRGIPFFGEIFFRMKGLLNPKSSGKNKIIGQFVFGLIFSSCT